MKKILSFGFFAGLLAAFVVTTDSFGATKSSSAKKQSALSAGTKVRDRVKPTGVYNEECYNQYFGCMDQFCIGDNENGGTCQCSDDAKKYDEQLETIKKTLLDAERISTEEVERVQAGAKADIIFNGGKRIYDNDGNVSQDGKKESETEKKPLISLTSFFEEDDEEDDEGYNGDDFADKSGKELYVAANKLCKAQMADSCNKDITMLTQIYSRQITSDCKGLANSIAQKKQEADSVLAKAKAAVRGALKESLEEANKYDRGTCMVEYKKCMMSSDACGSDWGNCVFTIASENMQNNAASSVAGTKVETINTYDITASTMSILESKRFICEKVLDSCVAVRDYVWNDFLREAAPTIRLAEQNIESEKRQSCLTDISNCIQKACKDDIAGKGVETMDACLARPDMARSFCKIQIDPCERMEPQIWDYVKSKLAAMRVDACTAEVKDCFTAEDRCGPDFINCIGMDFEYIHDICPIDKLVVCKQTNSDFKMSDLDEMLMGLYLNIDNKALENCQNLAEQKMTELCGSETDCNSFASDETIGTGSLKSQKSGSTYRVTGMISFGSIKMGDAMGTVTDGNKVLAPGEIGVSDYIAKIKETNKNVPNANAIISSIEEELNNIAGTINRTISLLESDQQLQYCITGRDLSQINGKKATKEDSNTTVARFPKLLSQYRTMIGMAALRKAQDNYNKKLNEEISNATKDASVDLAQYMCQMIPSGGGTGLDASNQTPLNTPYSISYDVASGIDLKSLTSGGKSSSTVGGNINASKSSSGGVAAGVVDAGAGAAWHTSTKISIQGGTKEVTSTFSRETRICHVCTTISVENCDKLKVKGKKVKKKGCKTEVTGPDCEDIQM